MSALSEQDREALRLVGCARHKAGSEPFICRPCADAEAAEVERIVAEHVAAARDERSAEVRTLRAMAVEAGATGAAEVIARVEAELLLTPCYVTRDEAMSCTDWIGGEFGNGVWLKAMCCLPCRIRAALAGQLVTPTSEDA